MGSCMCATSNKNTNFNISKNLLCKVEISILFAVEQFSSVFSKDKLMIRLPLRMSWENCRAVPSQQLPRVLRGAGT